VAAVGETRPVAPADPTYMGNERNGNNMTGSLPNAPVSGHWFSAQFQELLRNAYPPVS
jgi:cellulose 1,4-beta-cellobiosidase